jgi:Zn-dependent protease
VLGGFDLVRFLEYLIVLFISIAIHEFAHAWTADRLGDPTPRYQGRVTLNPLAHLEPLGTLLIVFSSLAGVGIGWGRPVLTNPYRLRYGPRIGQGIVAVAGPISNIIQACVAAIPYRLLLAGGLRSPAIPTSVFELLGIYIIVNIGLAVFNMIPLPPLDGAWVIQGILAWIGGNWTYGVIDFLDRVRMAGFMPLFLLVMLNSYVPILSMIMGPPSQLLRRFILGL